ncbi:MAG: aromatic ring-hydroxylating dioxygenase subunit alpha [Actinomycetota bacterium]
MATGGTRSDGLIHREAVRRSWHPIARLDDLGTEPLSRTLCGERLVLFVGDGGTPTALPDRCPHRNAPLSAGALVDGCLECPYHGWRFDDGGRCVEVPSSGPGAPVPPRAHLHPYPCVEALGLVWVALGEPIGDVPAAPWEADPAFRRINTPVVEWTAAAGRMVDNFMDITHFPWVHAESFGGAAERQVPNFSIGPLPDGFTGYAYDVSAANEGAGTSASGQEEQVVHRSMSSGFHLPFIVRSTIRYDTGLEHNLYLCTAPIDEERSWFTFIVYRNDDHDVPADEVLGLDHMIAAEDKRMLELLDGPLPLRNDGVVSVQADKASVAWKHALVSFLDGAEHA